MLSAIGVKRFDRHYFNITSKHLLLKWHNVRKLVHPIGPDAISGVLQEGLNPAVAPDSQLIPIPFEVIHCIACRSSLSSFTVLLTPKKSNRKVSANDRRGRASMPFLDHGMPPNDALKSST